MQEDSAIRQEQSRRATEEQIQAQRRQTEREKAEIERETIRVKSIAEAEGRAHEARLAEDVNRRMLVDRANAEREKWVAAINTTFEHIGGGLRAILTDQNKLIVAVGGATALAAGIYTTREGARVIWSYVDRILGQPSLIRESSRGKYPWSGSVSRALSTLRGKGSAIKNGKGFGDVILHPSLQKRIEHLAKATANTKSHQAPFRNMLFYGPPGTGKTMVARELARKSVFEGIRQKEETKQTEFAAKGQEYKAMQAQAETERQKVIYDEQKKLAQHQAQTKSQMARYEDDLARKRMQACNFQHCFTTSRVSFSSF
ncbi:hypothetical protein F2Q70_00024088 [Brassica cretica]|uniref:ATPase family AAA domain-containing protein n=1 Tax=Brassica cretica TaxID=69181 RepID=A0A8S9GVU7_BRACR|nr:hypothetical protein F2Q70_00024088 [Brassica cretica]